MSARTAVEREAPLTRFVRDWRGVIFLALAAAVLFTMRFCGG